MSGTHGLVVHPSRDEGGPREDLRAWAREHDTEVVAHVALVAFEDGEGFLAGLRRRGVIADSPRRVAHDERVIRGGATSV